MIDESLFTAEQHELFYRLCDQNLYLDAFACLREHGNRVATEYLWYEGYLQASLGWDEEAIISFERYKRSGPDCDLLGVTSGFMADIYHSDGRLYEANDEIRLALKHLPDDPEILRKAQEIFNDFNDQFQRIILAILIAHLLMRLILKR